MFAGSLVSSLVRVFACWLVRLFASSRLTCSRLLLCLHVFGHRVLGGQVVGARFLYLGSPKIDPEAEFHLQEYVFRPFLVLPPLSIDWI